MRSLKPVELVVVATCTMVAAGCESGARPGASEERHRESTMERPPAPFGSAQAPPSTNFYCRQASNGYARQCIKSQAGCQGQCFTRSVAYCFQETLHSQGERGYRFVMCAATSEECGAWQQMNKAVEPSTTACYDARPDEIPDDFRIKPVERDY